MLSLKKLLFLVVGILLVITGSTLGSNPPVEKPNIVLILADDLGASELGCYGHPTHRTPNLDKMAQRGVRFETAFTSPVCHPTRFMIMTGQYGNNMGVYNFPEKRGGPPEKHEGVDNIANHTTFAQILKPAGYATALAGKWQLSGGPPNLIYETGFDEYSVWGYREYFPDPEREKATQAGIEFRSRYWRPSIARNGKWLPTTLDDYGPDIHSAFLIDFIERNRDKPFFAYYPMCLTHGPWMKTPDTVSSDEDKTAKSDRANLASNVEYMDKIVGRLLSTVEKLGLAQKTIFIFTGDNGTGGDGKSQPTELGARVPMIVYGPGIVKQRGATKELTDMSDVFPTLVEFAGADLPQDKPIDGHSLAGFLKGEKETTREWIYAFQADRRIFRTKRWLLEDNSPLHWGRLFDCGERRDGSGYREVTDSEDPEVVEIKRLLNGLIAEHPVPYISHEGPPNEGKQPKNRKK